MYIHVLTSLYLIEMGKAMSSKQQNRMMHVNACTQRTRTNEASLQNIQGATAEIEHGPNITETTQV